MSPVYALTTEALVSLPPPSISEKDFSCQPSILNSAFAFMPHLYSENSFARAGAAGNKKDHSPDQGVVHPRKVGQSPLGGKVGRSVFPRPNAVVAGINARRKRASRSCFRSRRLSYRKS